MDFRLDDKRELCIIPKTHPGFFLRNEPLYVDNIFITFFIII